MKRIQGVTVATDLNGAGKNGFKDGNKSLGILATIVNALFMNQTQEEILSVIEASGRTPDDTNQLLPSILSLIKGGDYKDSVRFTTTANIVLTGLGTQAGGDWPAALTAGDRILAKNQTAGLESGIYIAAAGVWPRATDADTGAELNSGAIIPVESGTLNADTNWQLTTDGTVTIGTTALTFEQSGYAISPITSAVIAASSVALTSNSVANITSVTLGPGLWDISANGNFKIGGGTSFTGLIASISSVSATVDGLAFSRLNFPATVPNLDQACPVASTRIFLAATTIIYLVLAATFSVGTCGGYGFINAKQIKKGS